MKIAAVLFFIGWVSVLAFILAFIMGAKFLRQLQDKRNDDQQR